MQHSDNVISHLSAMGRSYHEAFTKLETGMRLVEEARTELAHLEGNVKGRKHLVNPGGRIVKAPSVKRRKVGANKTSRRPPRKLDDAGRNAAVLAAVRGGGGFASIASVIKEAGLEFGTVKKVLKQLKREGLVKCENKRKDALGAALRPYWVAV